MKGPAVVTTLLVSAGCWRGSPPPEPPPQACDRAGDCTELVFHGVALTPAGPLANTELAIENANYGEGGEPLPSVTTDERGRFAFRIGKTIRAVTITAIGYRPVISPVKPLSQHYEINLRPVAPPRPEPQPVT